MKIIVDGTTPEDLDDIVADLDPRARAVYEAAGVDPRMALSQALQMSQVRSIVKVDDDGDLKVLGVFGWWEVGYFWFAGTPELYDHWRAMVRLARRVVHDLLILRGGLYMYIDPRNEKDVRLAEWLGFKLVETFEFSPDLTFATYARST